MNSLTASSVYIDLIVNYLEQLKVRKPSLDLSKICLPETYSINANSNNVYLNELEDFVGSIVHMTQSQSLGLDLGAFIHPSDYGLFGYAVMSCSTLGQAIVLLEEYVVLLNQAFTINLVELDEFIQLELEAPSNKTVEGILVELQLVSICQIAKFLVGAQTVFNKQDFEIHFKHGPLAELSRYTKVLNSSVHFSQKTNKIIIPKTLLAKRIRSASPKMFMMLLKKLHRLKAELNNNVSFALRVSDFIESNILLNGVPTAAIVALHFNISLSTLKKHLQQEGYNYTSICDNVRHKIAIKMVAHSSDQLQNIGRRLGFSNTSAFNRAFRRWTKIAPAEYRRRFICNAQKKVKNIEQQKGYASLA